MSITLVSVESVEIGFLIKTLDHIQTLLLHIRTCSFGSRLRIFDCLNKRSVVVLRVKGVYDEKWVEVPENYSNTICICFTASEIKV